MSKRTTMSRTFDTLGNDTLDVFFDNLGFQAYGNCRERSSSPFRDYADRDLGSPSFLRMTCLLGRTGSWTSRWVSLADFSSFIFEEEHPSEADDEKRVLSFPLLFTWLYSRPLNLPHA